MDFLTKEQILAADDIPSQEVEVPEWGGKVLVRGLSAAERGAFTEEIIDQRGKKNIVKLQDIQVRICALAIREPATGKRMFDDNDLRALARKSAAALQHVFEVAQRLSGLSNEDVEELTKNSETAQSDDLLTG